MKSRKATALLNARKAAADESSKRRAELSNLSSNLGANNRRRNGRTASRMNNIPENNRGDHLIRDLDLSFMSVDSRGNITPKTPEAAYMAAHTYMMATKPQNDDPRAALYNTAMAGIGIMGAAIAGIEPERTLRRHNSPQQGEGAR